VLKFILVVERNINTRGVTALPLKESHPEIRSERLLREEKYVTHVYIRDNHETALSKGECLRMLFL
jgi:stress response protein YsnF